MTYPELQKILDKEGIGCLIRKTKHEPECLYLEDMTIYLFQIKEAIEKVLKLNDIKANVEVDEEKEVLTIKIEN